MALSDRVPGLETLTVQELLAMGDRIIQEARSGGFPHAGSSLVNLLTTAAKAEHEKRLAERKAFQNAEVVIGDVTLVPGRWYDVETRYRGSYYGRRSETYRGCRYVRREARGDLVFEHWGGDAIRKGVPGSWRTGREERVSPESYDVSATRLAEPTKLLAYLERRALEEAEREARLRLRRAEIQIDKAASGA